jgi:mediator of RNA polymerase II transcription subunit 8
LRRKLEDDESEEESEEEGDGDEMDVVGVARKPGAAELEFKIAPHHTHPVQPFVPLDLILRHMTTGRMP